MLKMKPDGQGRRTEDEIVAEARRLYGIDLVAGVAQVAEYSQATRCREWVASFTDSRCGYYAHQNASDFIQWETAPMPVGTGAKDVVFVFSMGTGYGSPLPQPSGQFDLLLNNTEPLISFRVTKESLTWRKGDVAFHYWVKRLQAAPPNVVLCLDSHIQQESMASYGIGFLKLPKSRLKEGQRAILRLAPKNRQASKRWFKLDVDTWARLILKADLDDGLAAVCAPPQPPMVSEFHVFFGDLHAHSGDGIGGLGKGCGTGTLDENYVYARDIAPLDFCAIAEHDWQMADQADWQRRLDKADEYNADGRFVTLPSFEWTSLAYGHRNVYYPESKWPFFSSGPKNAIVAGQCDTPADLWRKLREAKARAITGAHHHSVGFFPVDWSCWDPEFDRFVEVYSCWGNSEFYGAPHPGWASDRHRGLSTQDALARGYRLGLLASSDGHDGNPGNAQWSNRQPHIHHHLGSGYVAVLAPELSRKAIFDALYARRFYATTGVRIALDFRVNGLLMGSEAFVSSSEWESGARKIQARVVGTTNITRVSLLRNNAEICVLEGRGRTFELEYEDRERAADAAFPASPRPTLYYYLRVVQEDGEMAWSSPVWISVR